MRVNLEVVYEAGACTVARFRVEGSSHWLTGDTPFNEGWLDKVARRKLDLSNFVSLDDGFTLTRLGDPVAS